MDNETEATEKGKIQITIIDETGAKETKIKVPTDWTVRKLIDSFVTKLELPIVGGDGQPIIYHAVLKRTNQQLDDSFTIEKAGVEDGDVLRLVTTMIPGM